jgi:methylamine dehydrogenase heavy chain
MLTAALLSVLAPAHAALEADPMGQVVQLPEQYPAHWVIAHDIAFSHIRDGKGVVFDADADTIAQQFKGMFSSSFAAHFVQATTRPEMYVAETFYSRGTRGERLDVLTIYDKGTLAPVGEVLLESNSRSIVLPQKFAMQLTADESMLLVYNFSPAMSVSVVDLIGRRYLGDVPLPGCAPVFPTGQRGFSSLCADGTLYTVMLDDAGKAASSARTDQFFDSEADPLIEKPAWVNGRAYFPSFTGSIYPIDFTSSAPVIGKPWPAADEATAGWRIGGLAPSAADANGNVYFLAHPEGGEGTHRDPGLEIWVFDPVRQQRTARYPLEMPGLSVALTRDKESPLMIVTTVEMKLDVYDAGSGKLLRTISGFGEETPILVYGAR